MSDKTQTNQSSADAVSSSDKKLKATLFIGIGGTGMEIMMRVRRNILHANWGPKENKHRISSLTEFPIAQFLHIDLDAGATKDNEHKNSDSDPLDELVAFQKDERIFEKLEHTKYTADENTLSRYPHIKFWLPMADLSKFDLSKGAGQVRAISRLFFYDKIEKISSAIREKLRSLKTNFSREEDYRALGLDLQPNAFRVVILGSFAGGTGSGCFLDMGWLAKAITKSEITGDTQKCSVDMFYLLPTLFPESRTRANGYAGLLELEAAMKGGLQNYYIDRWSRDDDSLSPPPEPPFDDVYLIDSENIGGMSTDKHAHVYSMVADVLFEDFASEAWVSEKHSRDSNTTKYKLPRYNPPMSHKYGDVMWMFSRGYSSFGQAVLDTQESLLHEQREWDISAAILRQFFGIGLTDNQGNQAQSEVAKKFLEDFAYSSYKSFLVEKEKLKGETLKKLEANGVTQQGINSISLVQELLGDQQGAFATSVLARVDSDLDKLTTHDRCDEWVTSINKFVDEIESNIKKTVGRIEGTTEDRVSARRDALLSECKNNMRREIYAQLDNHELGGASYVESLIKQIKLQIEKPDSGLITDLDAVNKKARTIADALRSLEIGSYTEQIGKTKKMFGGYDVESARAHFVNAKAAIKLFVEWHLRAVAAREASALLDALSRWLGDPQGLGDGGNKWSGLMGEILEGRHNVQLALNEVSDTQAVVSDSQNKSNPCHILVHTQARESGVIKKLFDPALLNRWAAESFVPFGGSEGLFAKIKSAEGRKDLADQLVKKMRFERNANPELFNVSQGSDPLLGRLHKMFSSEERKALFRKCLDGAMPWIKTQQIPLAIDPQQYSCFIGVPDLKAWDDSPFQLEFLEQSRINGMFVKVVETGIPGKITCYIEFSGFPLDILADIKQWRGQYRVQSNESPPLPLHTHRDNSLFRAVRAPEERELETLASDFTLFLEGVMLGVLTSSNGDPNPQGLYYVEVSKANKESVGNERRIRSDGLRPEYKERVLTLVDHRLSSCEEPAQLAALALLAFYYAIKTYPPIEFLADQQTVKLKSFPHVLAMQLHETFKQRALRAGMSEKDFDDIDKVLVPYNDQTEEYDWQALNRWTKEIKDSGGDGFSSDVGKNPSAKRVVLKEFFTPGWLNQLASSAAPVMVAREQTKSAQTVASPAPVVLESTATQLSVADEIKKYGELKSLGLLTDEEFTSMKGALMKKLLS